LSQELIKGEIDIKNILKLCFIIYVNYIFNILYKDLLYNNDNNNIIILNNNILKYDIIKDYICLYTSILFVNIICFCDIDNLLNKTFIFTNELVTERIIYYMLTNEYDMYKKTCKLLSIIINNTLINIYKRNYIIKNLSKKILEYIIIEII
jgi:hypothetical protein